MFNFFKKNKKQQPDIVGEVVEKIMLPVAYDADLEKALNETFRPAFVGDDAAIEDESGVLNVDILRYYARANFRLTPQIQEELVKYWAINRACLMPVQDCLRNGYELVAEEQESVPEQVSKAITHFNKKFDLPKKLEDALYYSRVYGIRVCIFQFEGLTPEHYENPINWETLKGHKYKGFFMLSPQYCIPVQFEMNDPMRFRQVNYWKAANQKYHHSWVRLIHHCEVPANQLPMYLGGGVSLIQEIYEKVYQADQAANEALQILFTKNLTVRKGDTASAIMNQAEFEQKMTFFARMTGQFRQLFISTDEDYQNIERSLQGVEDLFAKYYEIVSAVAKIPNNRFMMTQLTGFAASGESEDRIYNSSNLSTLQVKLNPIIEMHNKAILITNGLDYENITIQWNKCGALTEAELADIQAKRIANDVQLVQSQIIAPEKASERLSKDKDSGYAGIDLTQPELGNNPLDGLDFSMFANAAQVGDDARWVTVGKGQEGEKGHKFKIDTESGKILAGGSPEMHGKTFSEAFRTEKNALAGDIAQAAVKKHGKGTVGEYLRGGAKELASNGDKSLLGNDTKKQEFEKYASQKTVPIAESTENGYKRSISKSSRGYHANFDGDAQTFDTVEKAEKWLNKRSKGTGLPNFKAEENRTFDASIPEDVYKYHGVDVSKSLQNKAAKESKANANSEKAQAEKERDNYYRNMSEADRDSTIRDIFNQVLKDKPFKQTHIDSETGKSLEKVSEYIKDSYGELWHIGGFKDEQGNFYRNNARDDEFIHPVSKKDYADIQELRKQPEPTQSPIESQANNWSERLKELKNEQHKSNVNSALKESLDARLMSDIDTKKLNGFFDFIRGKLKSKALTKEEGLTIQERLNNALDKKKGLILSSHDDIENLVKRFNESSDDYNKIAKDYGYDLNLNKIDFNKAKEQASNLVSERQGHDDQWQERLRDADSGMGSRYSFSGADRLAGEESAYKEKISPINEKLKGLLLDDDYVESQAAEIAKEQVQFAGADMVKQTTDSRPLQAGDVIDLDGYNVLIENPKGSVRHWTDQTGRSGESVLTCHYGELQGYTGADDDYLDVFIAD